MIKLNLYMMLASRKISQKELAEATNIRQATISSYCNNDFKHIVVSHLDKICYALNCTPNDIIIYKKDKIDDVVELTQSPMDMIKQFNEQLQYNREVQEKESIEDSPYHIYNQAKLKKEIIDDVSAEVFQKMVEYFSALKIKPENKE